MCLQSTLWRRPRELCADSSLFGCTGLLAELGILRTRAGVRRQRAPRAHPQTRRLKDYDYAVDADCHLRHRGRPHLRSARCSLVRTLRPADTRRPGPQCTCSSRTSKHVPASGGSPCVRRLAAECLPSSSPFGQQAAVVARAGSRDPDRRAGHLTVDRRSGRAVLATAIRAGAFPDRRRLSSHRRPSVGRAVLATAIRAGAFLDRRRLSSHRQRASRPRGPRDRHPGGGARARCRVALDRRGLSSRRRPACKPHGTLHPARTEARSPVSRLFSSAASRPHGRSSLLASSPGPQPGRIRNCLLATCQPAGACQNPLHPPHERRPRDHADRQLLPTARGPVGRLIPPAPRTRPAAGPDSARAAHYTTRRADSCQHSLSPWQSAQSMNPNEPAGVGY